MIVMGINSLHAHIDHLWGLIFIDLMHAAPRVGYQIYQSLSGGVARRAAIDAAAKERLSEADYQLFAAVGRALAPQRRRRNDFSHHLWGTSPEVPDALLLADPAGTAEHQANRITYIATLMKTREAAPTPQQDRSKIQVFTRAALIEAYKEAEEARNILVALSFTLHRETGERIDAQSRKRLLEYPRVARAHEALTRKSSRQTPPEPPAE